ncbi:MAG: ABC transporter ATP-binding protein [Clostridia bacterium]|nr:ABC transporter ATP-binding protein [Oscillospiraceae bacterium]MBQ7005969.1 ABC transporter ATP-binding protein [Clostridia bacterium]
MIKRLSKCIREYKLPSILTPVLVSLEVVMEVLIPYLMGKLIDDGIKKGDTDFVVRTGILLVILCLFSLFFGAAAGITAAKASAGFAKNLRHDMFHNVQGFSFSNIDNFSASGLVTRLTTDVTNLQNSYQMIIRIAVRSPAMLLFSLFMALGINGKISTVFLCVIPVLAIGLALVVKNAHPIFRRVFKTYDKLNNVVAENLHGIRVVKAFVRENEEDKKFRTVSEKIFADTKRAENILAFNAPMMQAATYACILLIAWFGANLIVSTGETEMTTGDLVSLLSYVMQILMNLMMLSMIFVMLTMSKAAGERVCEVLEEKSDLVNPENPVYTVSDGSIDFESVSFSYSGEKGNYCLRDAELHIKSGETVGIIGSTGSSKTTLVQLIARLYDATEGTVKVGGRDVREYDLDTLRNEVAMVLQKNVLFSGTIRENLCWGKEDATDEEIIEACNLAQAHSFIQEKEDGYDTYIEQGGSNVSGGQKQRICIARSLLKKPKILILDDSTSAVDTATDALIRKAFSEYIPETTKIIIAQRISSIEGADKIVVLDDGGISAVGNHEELLSESEIYREVYFSQQKGGKDGE